jgi:hypothetical protein
LITLGKGGGRIETVHLQKNQIMKILSMFAPKSGKFFDSFSRATTNLGGNDSKVQGLAGYDQMSNSANQLCGKYMT